MKTKWLSTPSPPKVIILGVLVFLILVGSLLAPTPLLAQGPDNLVFLMPSARVWNVGLDLGWMFDQPPFDPGQEWPSQRQWVFKTSSFDNGFGLILHCFTNHCGLEVKSQIATHASNQDVHEGVIYLEDLNLTYEQRIRAVNAIQRALELYKIETNPNVLASIYTGLLVWSRSYAVQASNTFMAVADRSPACSVKKVYYKKADDLGLDPLAGQLLGLTKKVKDDNCATITRQNLPLFSTNYASTTGVSNPTALALPSPFNPAVVVVVTSTPVVVERVVTTTPPPAPTRRPLEVSPTAPAALVVPVPTVTSQTQIVKETVVVNRVVTTTPPPATATMLPTPTGTSTALPLPTPAPIRKPGEKDLGEQIMVMLVRLLLLFSCLVIIAIAGIIGIRLAIRYYREVREKEQKLKAQMKQEWQARQTEGENKLQAALARVAELLGNENSALSEKAQTELVELLYQTISPLLPFYKNEKGDYDLAAGQSNLNRLVQRFRKQRKQQKIKE